MHIFPRCRFSIFMFKLRSENLLINENDDDNDDDAMYLYISLRMLTICIGLCEDDSSAKSLTSLKYTVAESYCSADIARPRCSFSVTNL